MTFDCDLSTCRLLAAWELTFPDRSRPWRYCGLHAAPHLKDPEVRRTRLR